MTCTIADRYPRTLYEWLKADDKALHKSLADGQSVLEAAEDLQREHITVLQRLHDLGLIEFLEHSEEWVEVMCLALDGVPMQSVIDWISATDSRPTHAEIMNMAMSGLRSEFELARQLSITVPNSDALVDLTWLAQQPDTLRSSYPAACRALIDAFDVVTPTTLKNQVSGLVTQKPGCIRDLPRTGISSAKRSGGWASSKRPRSAPTTTRTVKKSYRRKNWSSKKRSPSYPKF